GTSVVLANDLVPELVLRRGEVLSARFEVDGIETTTVRARVWRAGTPEPTGWLVAGEEPTPTALRAAGSVGALFYLSESWGRGSALVKLDALVARRVLPPPAPATTTTTAAPTTTAPP